MDQHTTYGDTWVGIRPKDVTKQPCIRHIARTGDVGNLFHLRKLWRQSSVHTDNLIIDYGTARQTVEGIAKLLPHLDREATTALIVKSVDTIDSGTFVVSPQKEEVFGILNFVRK
jgi:hypothetical protein